MVEISGDRSDGLQRDLVSIVRRMSAAMRYEPSYSEAVLSIPVLAACVGRVGLNLDANPSTPVDVPSIVAVTTGDEVTSVPTGAQPAVDSRLGPGAREVVRAYMASADEGFLSLSGIRSGFLADQTRRRCVLYNDKYGRERIFLHTTGTRVFFASEAKAILAAVPETRAFDATGLAEFMACGCTLGSQSLFRGIEVLAGGTALTFEGPIVKRRRYFDEAVLERLEPTPDEEFLSGFSGSLRIAVNESAQRMPKAGISLTGGLDSRMIMASLDAAQGTVPCYTFGSMYRTTGDVRLARQVAARSGQPHQVVELGAAFLKSIRQNFESSVYISDGYLGFSGAAELYVNREARSIAAARMTGNWGGELMRGVRAFKHKPPKGDFLSPDLAEQVSESALAFSQRSPNPLSAALFQQIPFQGYGRYAIERSQLLMRSPFLADDVVRCLYQARGVTRESPACATSVMKRRPELLAIPTDLGLLGRGPSFVRRALRRVLIKAEYLTSHGAPDWLARFSACLPETMLETTFLGIDKFQHFRYWTRHELADFVRQTLIYGSPSELEPWFDMRRTGQMVNDHIGGRANYTDEIDKTMTLAQASKSLLRAPQQEQAPEPRPQ